MTKKNNTSGELRWIREYLIGILIIVIETIALVGGIMIWTKIG